MLPLKEWKMQCRHYTFYNSEWQKSHNTTSFGHTGSQKDLKLFHHKVRTQDPLPVIFHAVSQATEA